MKSEAEADIGLEVLDGAEEAHGAALIPVAVELAYQAEEDVAHIVGERGAPGDVERQHVASSLPVVFAAVGEPYRRHGADVEEEPAVDRPVEAVAEEQGIAVVMELIFAWVVLQIGEHRRGKLVEVEREVEVAVGESDEPGALAALLLFREVVGRSLRVAAVVEEVVDV